MPITKVGRPCRDCKSVVCYCHDTPSDAARESTMTEDKIDEGRLFYYGKQDWLSIDTDQASSRNTYQWAASMELTQPVSAWTDDGETRVTIPSGTVLHVTQPKTADRGPPMGEDDGTRT